MKIILALSLLLVSPFGHALYNCSGSETKHLILASTVSQGHRVQGVFDCSNGEGSLELVIDGTPQELIYTEDGLDYAVIGGDQLLYAYYADGQLQRGSFDLAYELKCKDDPTSCTIPNGGG